MSDVMANELAHPVPVHPAKVESLAGVAIKLIVVPLV
ncbi:hypothetical protein BGP_6519 [Beggiatoa sp. PS]|nr:hypothetical protein BGP_6519 [Beggiatoa sp. PS]